MQPRLRSVDFQSRDDRAFRAFVPEFMSAFFPFPVFPLGNLDGNVGYLSDAVGKSIRDRFERYGRRRKNLTLLFGAGNLDDGKCPSIFSALFLIDFSLDGFNDGLFTDDFYKISVKIRPAQGHRHEGALRCHDDADEM